MHRFESLELQDWIQQFCVYKHLYLNNFCVRAHGFFGSSTVWHSSHIIHISVCISIENFTKKISHAKKAHEAVGEAIPYHRLPPAISLVAA